MISQVNGAPLCSLQTTGKPLFFKSYGQIKVIEYMQAQASRRVNRLLLLVAYFESKVIGTSSWRSATQRE